MDQEEEVTLFPLSLSFLDTLACALGACFVMFMIYSTVTPGIQTKSTPRPANSSGAPEIALVEIGIEDTSLDARQFFGLQNYPQHSSVSVERSLISLATTGGLGEHGVTFFAKRGKLPGTTFKAYVSVGGRTVFKEIVIPEITVESDSYALFHIRLLATGEPEIVGAAPSVMIIDSNQGVKSEAPLLTEPEKIKLL